MKRKGHILNLIILLLLLLWIPVTLDKFWDLTGFRQTLLRQPFPDAWAEVLYWLLPVLEGLCVLLLVGSAMANPRTNPVKGFRAWGFALSTILMVAFTLFILFGVLGWYEKRPCGCGSVISGLSWNQHLWFNLVFLLVSVVGWWLGRDVAPDIPARPVGPMHPKPPSTDAVQSTLRLLAFRRSCRLRYPRKFALFPGRPVGQPLIPSYTLDSMGAVSRMDAGDHLRWQPFVKSGCTKKPRP